jgi:hypothetical protein
MEGGVVLDELLGGEPRPLHRLQRLGHRARIGPAPGGELGRPPLDHQPRLDDVAHRQAGQAQVQAQQVGERAAGPRAEHRARVHAPPDVRGHHAQRLQHAHRLAHRRAADLKLLGELPLPGEPVARPQPVGLDPPLDLGEHLLEGAGAPHRTPPVLGHGLSFTVLD